MRSRLMFTPEIVTVFSVRFSPSFNLRSPRAFLRRVDDNPDGI